MQENDFVSLYPDAKFGRSEDGREIILPSESFKEEFLRIVAGGFGRAKACLQSGISMYRLRQFFKVDPEFLQQVITTESACEDEVEGVVHLEAISGNLNAAAIYLGRRDRVKAARQRTRMLQEELKLKKKLVALQENRGPKFDVRAFSNEELARFDELCDIAASGGTMTPQQAEEFGRLNAKMHQAVPESKEILYDQDALMALESTVNESS